MEAEDGGRLLEGQLSDVLEVLVVGARLRLDVYLADAVIIRTAMSFPFSS